MRNQIFSFEKKQKTILHLVLVLGVFSYLYSPFLDHFFDHEVYARPHNHIHFPIEILAQNSIHYEPGSIMHHDGHEHHEEGFLCFLDIDALLALLLAFNITPDDQFVCHHPLVFGFDLVYFHISILHLSPLNPPPIF